jgi:hypothetical protein
MIIRQRIRISGGVKLPAVILQLQGGVDRTKVILADSINVFHGHLVDGIPEVYIHLVAALGWSIKVVLETIGQERPGQRIIPGIDIIEIIGNESLRRPGRQSGRLRKSCRKAGLDGGIWKSGQRLDDDGLDEVGVRIRWGGRAQDVKPGTGRKGNQGQQDRKGKKPEPIHGNLLSRRIKSTFGMVLIV